MRPDWARLVHTGMTSRTSYARPGAAAIVAAFALSSTSLSAQEAVPVADVPVASDPAPSTVETTAPVAEPTPTPSEPVLEASPAPAPTAAAKPKAVKSATAKATAKPAAVVAAPTPTSATAPTAVAEPVVNIPEAMADPVVTAPVEPTAAPLADDSLAEIAFGGALALLVLGGGAVALSRRRKSRELADERDFVPITARAPDVTPAPVTERSAFTWGQSAPAQAPAMVAMSAGGSAIERARRGPTPDNPSLSLKKRLKRATFFEQREREIAAGKAKPIDNLAGLPKKLADAAQRRASTAEPKYGRVLQPA